MTFQPTTAQKNSSLLNSYYMHFSVLFMIQNDDETFPITNKPKHPKKGEYKEHNGRTHIQVNKRTT